MRIGPRRWPDSLPDEEEWTDGNLTHLQIVRYKERRSQWFSEEEGTRPTELGQMMASRKVVDYVSAEPFRPFRIKMVSGQKFEIRHPEMILVGRTTARVFTTPETDSANGEHWHEVSLLLMESLEPIESSGG